MFTTLTESLFSTVMVKHSSSLTTSLPLNSMYHCQFEAQSKRALIRRSNHSSQDLIGLLAAFPAESNGHSPGCALQGHQHTLTYRFAEPYRARHKSSAKDGPLFVPQMLS